ncbi:MAG: hypothetical protein QFC55_01205 [Chloroflexota bacterium]|nr:hypothetical protein [Chloroflexota bacterium]
MIETSSHRDCALVRTGLVPPVGGFEVLAAVPTTGLNPTPGTVRLADTIIDFATIDNTRYGYFLQCQIESVGGIFGADVIYTITAAKG